MSSSLPPAEDPPKRKTRWRRDKGDSKAGAAARPASHSSHPVSHQPSPNRPIGTVALPNAATASIHKAMRSSQFLMCDSTSFMDFSRALEGGSLYLPSFFGDAGDLFEQLSEDVVSHAEGEGGLVSWSQHLKARRTKGANSAKHTHLCARVSNRAVSSLCQLEDPDFSRAFQSVLQRLSDYFDLEVYASRLNFYRCGSDWKPYHHDSHAYSKDRGHVQKEDFTVGASFGASRELAFKHKPSGSVFSFPQQSGDIFAFNSLVNERFKHGVPKVDKDKAGPRISVIAWGKRRSLNTRNAGLSELTNS